MVPVGSALNRNDDNAMAAKRAIMHEERRANKPFPRARVLCILAVSNTYWELPHWEYVI